MMDGQFFDMEAHLVHAHNVTGEVLVIAVFMKSDPSLKAKCIANGNVHITCKRANLVEQIFLGGMLQNQTVPAVVSHCAGNLAPASYTKYMNKSIDPYMGFVPPLGLKYYTYNGSLTTPPCTAGVQWILHAVPVLIYSTTVDLWKNVSSAYIDNGLNATNQNARALQPADGRKLYVAGKCGYSVLTQAANVTQTKLVIADHCGFAVGDTIIIEPTTSRQEGNTIATLSFVGGLVTTTPLHYSHPAGASVYSQTTTSPGITTTPAAGVSTTTPVATVTPIAPIRRYTEGKDGSKDQDKTGFASNAVYLAVGGLIGFSVVMIVQGARSKMQSAASARSMEADADEGEARLLSSLE